MTAKFSNVVLISCGSFNPITNMHLRLFELARDSLVEAGNSVIGGIISPTHDSYGTIGKKTLLSSTHRCKMIQLALGESNWIKLNKWETEQSKWIETAPALRHYQDELIQNGFHNFEPHSASVGADSMDRAASEGQPSRKRPRSRDLDNSETTDANASANKPRLMLLCGADLLESFSVPGLWKQKHVEEIVRDFGLVAVSRVGTDPNRFIYESDLLSTYKHNIFIVTEWIENTVSSTKIRRAIRRGQSIRYLVDNAVARYIADHGLYRE